MWIKEVIGKNETAAADVIGPETTAKTTNPSTQKTTTMRTTTQTTTRSTTTTTAARISTTATSTTRTDNIGELLNFLSCLPRDLDAYKKCISAAE